MNLLNYWFEEKIKPQLKPSKGRLFLAGLLLTLIFFFLGRYSLNITPLPPRVPLEEIKLPEVDLTLEPRASSSSSLSRFGLSLTVEDLGVEDLEREASPSARLRLLSATLIPIYEQTKQEAEPGRGSTSDSEATESAQVTSNSSTAEPQARLVGLRILGEYQNISKDSVEDIQAIVYFFDEKDNLIAKKIAQETSPFRFLPTAPQEITLYDILVVNPPASNRLQVNLKAQNPPPTNTTRTRVHDFVTKELPLKLKEKKLKEEQNQTSGQKITYYQLTAALVNTGEKTLTNPLLYVWLKDEEEKVFAVAYKEFPYDILAPTDELEVILPVVPLKEAKLTGYEVKLWAKELGS